MQVAYWLLQHKINVMMAACDTFRSGAVEQLRTHARRLQVYYFATGPKSLYLLEILVSLKKQELALK